MNHRLVITYIHEYNDRGAASRNIKTQTIPIRQLQQCKVFDDVFGHKLEVLSIDGQELIFKYRGKLFSLNMEWQVLGTVSFSLPNDQVRETYRMTFHFENLYTHNAWDSERMEALLNKMRANENEGYIWKNIRLGRELMNILKDVSPLRDEKINPTIRKYICECVVREELLDKKDTLRLFLSFNEYWRICTREETDEDEKTIECEKNYHQKIDSNLSEYTWLLFEPGNKYSKEVWNGMGMLKNDPIQLTPEWEKSIYQVECECERRLENEPHGMGFCHTYWQTKRAVLANYGITWKSPSMMNPKVLFD